MNFLRSRDEQLSDYLRDQILHGQLSEPLPNMRDWAARLGVSYVTLHSAIHALQREKLVRIEPREGVRLTHAGHTNKSFRASMAVRVIYRGADYPETLEYIHWYGLLSQRLQAHGIQLNIERCSDARLRELCRIDVRKDTSLRDLFFLRSLSASYQRLFALSGKPSLIVGYPAPGVSLPYVTSDLEGAIRHATNGLLRRGFTQLHFLINGARIHANQRQCEMFASVCQAWSHQPVRGEIVRVPLQPAEQIACLHRFAGRMKGRQGIIVVLPVSPAAVMTTLMGKGLSIPDQVEVVLINSAPVFNILWPPPIHYYASTDIYVKALVHAAVHFFNTGVVSRICKTVPMEMIQA